MTKIYGIVAAFLLTFNVYATDENVAETDSLSSDSMQIDSAQMIIQMWADNLKYETNTVTLANGIAELKVPKGYKYLNAADSRKTLQIWGNPDDPNTLGLLFKEEDSPLGVSTFVIEISNNNEGYIEDDEAEDMDFDEILAEMKKDEDANGSGNKLIGWASAPFYDAENKKLHWAKEIRFAGTDANQFNYDVRILGRNGYLTMRFIGEMSVFPQAKKDLNGLLTAVNYKPGHKYEDFDSSIDEVAAIGIGGLVAGKVLAKVGLWAVLLKFGKLIVFGIIALVGGFWKKIVGLFRKKKEEEVAPAIGNDENTPQA